MKTVQLLARRVAIEQPLSVRRLVQPLSYATTTTISQTGRCLSLGQNQRSSMNVQCAPLPSARRSFTTAYRLNKGMTPDSADPKPPNTETHDSDSSSREAASISDAEYHEIADQYMNALVLTLEEMADSDVSKGLEVEYSAGVLTINHASKGDYVLNKQPPNKQIWLSSPISGPKRFDWVLQQGGGMHSKQDTEGSMGGPGDDGIIGGGKWIYLRDGTSLSELLQEEIDVVIAHEHESDVVGGREGPGASGSGGGTGAVGGVEG